MDYNCQLIHIREWPEKKTEFEVEREVEWISVKCTLPTATLILGAYGKIDLDMEGWKELNFKKKKKMYGLQIFILQGVCLKGKLKR